MRAVTVVAGVALEITAWWLVAFRRRDVWRVTVPALVALGAAALLTGRVRWSPRVAPGLALAAGCASGAILYAATRAFVAVVRPWERFQRHSLAMYLRQGGRSLGWALFLSVALSVPGEELFWRGLVRSELAPVFDGRAGVGAVAAWALFVLANLPSANLAIVAGAVVGGALWTGLAWWTGGVLASIASHAVWTALMLVLPVVRAPEAVA